MAIVENTRALFLRKTKAAQKARSGSHQQEGECAVLALPSARLLPEPVCVSGEKSAAHIVEKPALPARYTPDEAAHVERLRAGVESVKNIIAQSKKDIESVLQGMAIGETTVRHGTSAYSAVCYSVDGAMLSVSSKLDLSMKTLDRLKRDIDDPMV